MNKRLFSMFLALCMIVAMLPMTALAVTVRSVTVGGVTLTYEHAPVYATTDASGTVTLGGKESNYNIKLENNMLTLRNANIRGVYIETENCGIYTDYDNLIIVLEGENTIRGGSVVSGGTYGIRSSGNLTLSGNGNLTVGGGETTSGNSFGIFANNLTIDLSGSLTTFGGSTSSNYSFSCALYASNFVVIDRGTVVAVGGTASGDTYAGSYGIYTGDSNGTGKIFVYSGTVTAVGGTGITSCGLYAPNKNSILITDGAVTAVGGEGAALSSGAFSFGGDITVGGGKLVAVGGKSNTESYGLYAKNNGGSVATITYTGGLLVARGGKATTTSLAMNKALAGVAVASAAVTTNASAATNASKYCVVSPKTSEIANYHVVEGSVSSTNKNETTGHITWDDNNLALNNTVIIAPDSASAALALQPGAMLTQTGFNVLLGGDATTSYGVTYAGADMGSGLTITGSGALVAVGGAATDITAGILGVSEISDTGYITAIGGSSNISSSYGIRGNPGINSGSGVAIAGQPGEGGLCLAFYTEPTLTSLATTGVWNGQVMTWGSALMLRSAAPTATTTTVVKTAATQPSVAFTLTTYPTGTYKVYADNATSSIHGEVTASLSGSTLTLTHASDIPAGSYYVSVTETGKAESTRLPLTVGEYVATCRLTVNLNGGNGSTTDGDYTAGTVINIDAGTKANHSFSGWTSSGGGSFGKQSSSSTTFTMPPNDTTITANWSYSGYTPPASAPSAPVIVDGKTENIGTEKKTGDTTTVTVDQSKLGTNIGGAAAGSSVVVPVSESGTATASLMVKNIAEMAEKGMTLTVQTGGVAYNLNSSAIDTAALTAAFPGADMSKVPFDVTIANSSVSVEGETLVLSPVAFTVTATYDGKTVDVDTFSAYIDRVIEVTAEQAAKITTAVVVNADGSVRHVPTNVIEKDGKYYAVVSSRTNSTYALIQNDVTFSDAAGKWYEAAVNEMGSRKIIAGRSASAFDGDAGITRAEFAVILVRALGLPADGISTFSDVPADAWYSGAVATAVTYSIVSGKGDNQFDPDANITRQEAMLMLQRASVLTEFTGAAGNLDSFADAGSVGTWAQDAAKWSVGSGLIQGSDGKLNPTADITRAESATIILRLLQKAGLVGVRSEA